MESKVEEIDVTVDDFFGELPHLKAKRCNTKLKIYREFVLATLQSISKRISQDAYKSIKACDAISGCGIAGLQWKKHLPQIAQVILADQDDLTKLKSNAVANSLTPKEIFLDGRRLAGDSCPTQTPTEVHVCWADAKVLMMMESYEFIYLNPHKSCVTYIEPAFQNVTNGGVVSLVVPDISVFARSAHVVQRYYAADVIKTEYLKEMAARVVLATMARAAARFNKGINPLFVLAKEDFILITVKVQRGHGSSDSSLKEISKLLHCRFCEERIFLEQQLAPDENPYGKLGCQCKSKNTGKTAVLIGPMWKGHIFDSDFLAQLQADSVSLPLSSSFHELLSLLISESLCLPSPKKDIKFCLLHRPSGDKKETGGVQNIPCIEDESIDSKKNIDCQSPNHGKRQIDLIEKVGGNFIEEHQHTKRSKIDSQLEGSKETKSGNISFYYSIKKCKTPTLPKLDQYVSLLHQAGHLASRTHFDPVCIRTSATVEQFLSVL